MSMLQFIRSLIGGMIGQNLVAILLAITSPLAWANSDFISLCYHEVEADGSTTLSPTALRASDLAAQFAWLQANGYHAVSINQILAAREGGAALPDKAVLLTFDDGTKDVFTRVFPLLKLFKFPAVVALTGHWLDVAEGASVDYDGTPKPRSNFVTWADVRAMQASGLVEIASHSYDLHRSVLANPQGNTQPAAITRLYADGKYEDDAAYIQRIRDDLQRNQALIARHTGHAPRVMVWPYGRSNGMAQAIAGELGMPIGLTLIDGTNTASTPLTTLKRHLVSDSPPLQSFAEALRNVWSPDPLRSVSIAPRQWQNIDADLSIMLDRLLKLSPNITFIDPRAAGDGALFPNAQRPHSIDALNRIAWQIERRAGGRVFIDIPQSWLGDKALLAALAKQVNFAGVRLPVAPGDPRAATAVSAMRKWRAPLQVAYAPKGEMSASDWAQLGATNFVIVPATASNFSTATSKSAAQTLFEFSSTAAPSDTAQSMRRIEADGLRNFGLSAFTTENQTAATDGQFNPVWRAFSLRSQPLLP